MAIRSPRPRRQSKRLRLLGLALRRSWSTALVALLGVALVVAAVLVPGLHINDAHLNAGSIVVVKTSASLVGNVNLQSDDLASAAVMGSKDFEVLQTGDLVIARNHAPDQMSVYSTGDNVMGPSLVLPTGAQVVLGGDTLAVLAPENGRVWFGPASVMAKTNFQQVKAQLSAGANGQVTVTTTGKVIALDVQHAQLLRLVQGAVHKVALPSALSSADVQLSAVGDQAVVLDRRGGRLWIEGGNGWVAVNGAATAQLAAPAPATPAVVDDAKVVFASAAGLVAWTARGTRSVAGRVDGTPITPLVMGDCAYAVQGATFVKACAGAQPVVRPVPELLPTARLQFAQNRGNVVLNDTVNGYIWLVDKNLKLIKDWTGVNPQDDARSQTNPRTDQVTNPERLTNHQPVATDDRLRARKGRSTYLPILDNDGDPDGDVITIAEVTDPAVPGASLQIVNGGTGLQITLSGGASGVVSFGYRITDGRGGFANAHVTVTVLGDQLHSNEKPVHWRQASVVIGQGQEVHLRPLLDWRDPDGDDLVLVDATVVGDKDDTVTWTPDGQVTFQDVGKSTGIKRVRLTVSDGRVTTTDFMLLSVDKKRVVAPVANADFVTTEVGQDIVVSPLANDIGTGLTLGEVKPERDTSPAIVPNPLDNTFTVRVDKPGTFYLTYKVSNGQVSTGLVRVDVLERPRGNHPPVAARDVVLLPKGGRALLDPLQNDTDADHDVLVVQGVDAPPGLSVTITQRHLITIAQTSVSGAPVTLTYYISDGSSVAQGTIVVIPTDPPRDQQPRAGNDFVKARAGSVVAVPVLANDKSPIGLDLSVSKITDAAGRAWIDGDKVRIAVPPGASTAPMTVTYEVRDADGQTDSATIVVTVISPDAPNEAPRPQAVDGRMTAGTTTKIPIAMTGLDPNGDPVHLVGIGSGPRLGRVVSVGPNYLVYQAFDRSSGTDSFRYQVADNQGGIGTGVIRIGIAQRTGNDTPPTVVNDYLTVRPGRPVTMPLLANDTDVDGDSFGFSTADPIKLGSVSVTPLQQSGAITFTSPASGSVTGSYTVVDSRGASSTGAIVVTTDPTAPLLAPVAADDLVPLSAIIGKTWVSVPVLANDYDPDGSVGQLTVSVPAGQGSGTAVPRLGQNRAVVVPVGERTAQYRYVVTDADGKTTSAVVQVPGRADLGPTLRPSQPVRTVTAGQKVTIDLNQYIVGTTGGAVHLVSLDTPVATVPQLVPGIEKLEWTPTADYAGPAAISVEVIDQVRSGSQARRAWVTLVFKVVPPTSKPGATASAGPVTNKAPELIGSVPVLKVGVGETARLQLTNFYSDPEGDAFHFQDWQPLSPASGPVTWTSEQTTITATATYAAQVGSRIVINGLVVDAQGATNGHQRTPTVTRSTVQVIIVVVSSTRPPPTAVADVVTDAAGGRPSTVDVLANDLSNLIGKPELFVTQAAPVGVPGTTVTVNNRTTVTVTPPKDFHGDMTVVYTVVDATLDATRSSQGVIRLTVRSGPGKPGVPVQQEVGDGYVIIKWADGDLNGLPLTGRTVTGVAAGGATVTQACETNTCKITGLTNARNYTFTVTQTNELGSATSNSSAVMRPDVQPDPMAAPQVVFGNGQLTLRWAAAVSRGSAVDQYRITNVESGATRVVDPGRLTYVWDGLVNGQSYQFTIAAHNEAGWSSESSASTPEHPTGPPPPPGTVAAGDAGNAAGGWISITWATPVGTGPDPITGYDIKVTGPGIDSYVIKGLDAETTSFVWKRANNGVEYQFVVIAHNRGPATSQATSPTASAFGAPNTPNGATAEAVDSAIKVSSLPNVDNGRPTTRFEMQVNDTSTPDGWSAPRPVSVGDAFLGLQNGRPYVVRFRAWADTKASDWSTPTSTIIPRGVPLAPLISAGSAVSDAGQLNHAKVVVLTDQATTVGGTTTNNGQPQGSYSYTWSTSDGQSGSWSPGDTVYVNTPATVTVNVVVGGQVVASNSVTLAASMTLSGDSTQGVTVSLNGWRGGAASCVASGSVSGTESVALPTGQVTIAPPVGSPTTPGPVTVTCTSDNGTVQSATMDLP